ncbi:MAG: hypothetical protein M0R38_12335 [Bacteroidia bacterium]|nr:hypothetical protein [Bacteroidia bacterium]
MEIPTTFSIDFVGELEKVNELISKVAAKVYYKGGNRNGTWITDDFAEKLNKTIFNVPIVASYNPETEDFEDHEDNGHKKAYGFVPAHSELKWIEDESGKNYLTTDVYLWVGYWPEAAKIINKSQSMELDKNTISGDWKVIGGDYYFVYQTGSFKGLCALGDTVLPCFENSAFFNLDEDSRLFFEGVDIVDEKNLGGKIMEENLNAEVVVVDEATIATVTNTEEVIVTEENTIQEEVVEEIAVEEFVADEEEINTVSSLVADTVSVVEEHSEVINNEDGSTTIINEVATNLISIETYYALQQENEELKQKVADLESEVANLTVYKDAAIDREKMEVVDSFKKRLSEEEISPFVESLANYSTEELRTKLSVVLANKVLGETVETISPEKTNFVSVPGKIKEEGIVSILRKNRKD